MRRVSKGLCTGRGRCLEEHFSLTLPVSLLVMACSVGCSGVSHTLCGDVESRHKAQDPTVKRSGRWKRLSSLKNFKELSWNLFLASPKQKEEEKH